MPTDRQPTEQEMAREALGLLRAHATGGWIKTASGLRLPDNAALCFFRAKHIHERYGSCPGFWGEVLAATEAMHGGGMLLVLWTTEGLGIEEAPSPLARLGARLLFTSPNKKIREAAILAALRAVVGAV